MVNPSEKPTGFLLRPYTPNDHDQVLALIEADRLPGQPATTPQALREAISGYSQADAPWWNRLTGPRTDVLVSTAEHGQHVLGVVSYAHSQDHFAGFLLWMHAREHPAAVATLVEHVLTQLAACRYLYAFDLATPLTPGFGALPVHRRPMTASVLRSVGFAPTTVSRYLHRALDPHERLPVDAPADTRIIRRAGPAPHSWVLIDAVRGDLTIGQVAIANPVGTLGELWWWLTSPHTPRQQRVGHALLHTALAYLQAAGATDVIARVPPHPGGGSDQAPTDPAADDREFIPLAGFTETDLLVYLARGPEHPTTPSTARSADSASPTTASDQHHDPDANRLPLLRMLSTIHTAHGKTYVLDPTSVPGLELTAEVYRTLCDALGALTTDSRDDPHR